MKSTPLKLYACGCEQSNPLRQQVLQRTTKLRFETMQITRKKSLSSIQKPTNQRLPAQTLSY